VWLSLSLGFLLLISVSVFAANMTFIQNFMLFYCTFYAICAADNVITQNKFRKVLQYDIGLQIVSGEVFRANSVLACTFQCLQMLYTAFIYDPSSLICRPGVGIDPLGTKPLVGQSMYVADWLYSNISTQGNTSANLVNSTLAIDETSTTVGQISEGGATDPSDSTTGVDLPISNATETATTLNTTPLPCDVSLGYTLTAYNTSSACLYVSTFDYQYFASETNCSKIRGRLATMKSLEKRDTILRFLQNYSTKSRFWLGLKAFGVLAWSDGKNMTVEEKSLGFYVPSTCSLSTCGCYAYNKTLDKLADIYCTNPYPFICEYVS
jgi:Lectin C-type domain